MFNFAVADIYRFWRFLGIWKPFAFAVFLFCHAFGACDSLKKQKIHEVSFSRFTRTGFVRTKRNNFFFGGFSQYPFSRSPREGVDTCRGGTGLSVLWDGINNARPTKAGRKRRLTGHKQLRIKFSPDDRDVSSCRFFLWSLGRDSLHFTQSRLSMPTAAGVVVWVHIGQHWAEGVGRAPPGGVCVGVWFNSRLYYPFGKGPGQH